MDGWRSRPDNAHSYAHPGPSENTLFIAHASMEQDTVCSATKHIRHREGVHTIAESSQHSFSFSCQTHQCTMGRLSWHCCISTNSSASHLSRDRRTRNHYDIAKRRARDQLVPTPEMNQPKAQHQPATTASTTRLKTPTPARYGPQPPYIKNREGLARTHRSNNGNLKS